MAKDKKSFIAYVEWGDVFEALPNQEAGMLIKHIFRYVKDENPDPENDLIKLLFIPIKNTLKRDLKKWDKEKSDKSDAGVIGNLKRWHPDLYKKYLNDKSRLSELQNIAKHRKTSQSDKKIAVNVNDNVNVNVNDNVIDILLEKESKELFNEWLAYRKEIKKPIKSKRTLKQLAQKIKEAGPRKSAEVINLSISNGWQGLFWNHKNLHNKTHKTAFEVIQSVKNG